VRLGSPEDVRFVCQNARVGTSFTRLTKGDPDQCMGSRMENYLAGEARKKRGGEKEKDELLH